MKIETKKKEEKRIRFRNLSLPLKIPIIMWWITTILYVFAFSIGVMIGMLS